MLDYTNPTDVEVSDDETKKKKKKLDFEAIRFEDEKGQEIQPEQKKIDFAPVGYETDEGQQIATPVVPRKPVSRKTGTAPKVGQPEISPEEMLKKYQTLEPDTPESKDLEAKFQKRMAPREYERLTMERRGTWSGSEQEKRYNEEGQKQYLQDAKRLRELRASGAPLSKEDLAKEAEVTQHRQRIREFADQATQQFETAYGKRPSEGLVGQEKSVVRLNNVDVDTRATMPEADEKGNITGFSGSALFDADSLKGLKGEELREAGVKKYTSMLGFNGEEQNAILETAKLLGEPLWKKFSDNSPLEDVEDLLDEGDFIPDGDKTYIKFQDRDVTLAKLGLLARIAKAETGSADPKTIKEYFDRLKSVEDEENKTQESELKGISETEGFFGKFINGIENAFTGFADPDSQPFQEAYAKKILGNDTHAVNPSATTDVDPTKIIEFKHPETEKAVKQLLAVRNYQQNTKYQQVFLEASRRPDGRMMMLANPLIYFAIKQSVPDIDKYLPTPEKTGQAVGMMAPALLPYVGMPLAMVQMEAQLRDSDPDSYNKMMFTGLATMGLGRVANAFRPAIGTIGVGATQTALGGVQTGVNYAINWEAYKNKDGSTNWGNLMQDLTVDIAQSGLDIGETAKGISGKVKAEPHQMLNMVVRNSETGKYGMFVMNPDSKVLEFRPVNEGKVATWRAAQDEAKRQYIVQDLAPQTFDNLIQHGSETVREGLNNLLFGTSNPVRDRAEVLAKSQRTDVKSDIGKATFDEDGNITPAKSGYHVAQRINEADRAMSALKLLDEYKAPLNIHTNLLTEDSVNTIRQMESDGLVKVDKNGQVNITAEGQVNLSRLATATEDFTKLVQDTKTLFGEGKNFKIPEPTGDKPTGQNEVMGKIAEKPKTTINTSISEVMTMGEADRRALAVQIAKGNAEFNPETGQIRNTDFTVDHQLKRFNFGRDGEQGMKLFNLGRDIVGGRVKKKVDDSADVRALKNQAEARFKELTGLKDFNINVPEYDAAKLAAKEAAKATAEASNAGKEEAPKTKPSVWQKQASKSDTELNSYEFSGLGEKEQLRGNSITVKDKSGRITTFHKDRFGLFKSGDSEASIPRVALEKQIRDGIYTVGKSKAEKTSLGNWYRDLNARIVKVFDRGQGDPYILSEEDHQTNYLNYAFGGHGEVKVDSKTSIDMSHSRWDASAEADFEQSKADDTRYYANDRMVRWLRQLDRGFYVPNLRDVNGITFDKITVKNFKNRVEKLRNGEDLNGIRSALNNDELKQLENFVATLPDGTAIDIVGIRPRSDTRPNYGEFATTGLHEAVHKHLLNTTGSRLFQNQDVLQNLFQTDAGQKFLNKSLGNSIYSRLMEPYHDYDSISHEVLAMATNKDTLHKLGVDDSSPEDINNYASLYSDIIQSLADEYGAKAVEKVLAYADPEIKKALQQVRENENSKLQSSGRGLEVPTGTRQGGLTSESSRAFDELGKGTGVRRLKLLRFTPTGNPFDLTGIRGAEHQGRVRDGATPTFNFYVQKPDGTFSFEREFTNTKLLPSTAEGNFNLLDIYTDVEARAVLQNLPFPKFQEWAETKGYHGFFNSNPDVADAFRYRVGMFDNAEVRKMIGQPELAMEAYHGTPHDFEKFDISKIGTGEGFQAFGHGLYFTSRKDIAQHYRDALAKFDPTYDGVPIRTLIDEGKVSSDITVELNHLSSLIKGSGAEYATKLYNDHIRNTTDNLEHWKGRVERIKSTGGDTKIAESMVGLYQRRLETLKGIDPKKFGADNGKVFKVDLAPTDDELLHWDKPVAEQPENIRKIIQDFVTKGSTISPDAWLKSVKKNSSPSTTDLLKKLGIRGIKYLDGFSRRGSEDEPNYNFVIFDDKDVTILQKANPVRELLMEASQKGRDQNQYAKFGYNPEQTFYSEVERAVTESNLPEKATGQQYLNIVRKAQGVRKEELEWSGLQQFLESNPKLTKDEVLKFVKENKVQIEETRYGNTKAEIAKLKTLNRVAEDLFSKLREAESEYWRKNKRPATLEQAVAESSDPTMQSYYAEYKKVTKERRDLQFDETKWADYGNLVTEGDRYDDVEIVLGVPSLEKGNPNSDQMKQAYQSGHWDDVSNAVVHIRGNGRDTVDGAKAFLIEEFQSDLHQEGRERGYDSPENQAEIKALSEKANELNQEMRALEHKLKMDSMLETPQMTDAEKRRLGELYDENGEYHLLRDKIRKLQNKIPPAPFKDTWHEVAFKRALRWAVEQGFDKIAWTTGRQQIDRNETALRQNVDKIEYVKVTPEFRKEASTILFKAEEEAKVAKAKVDEISRKLEEKFDKEEKDKVDQSRGTGFIATSKIKYVSSDHDYSLAYSDWKAKETAVVEASKLLDSVDEASIRATADGEKKVVIRTFKDGKNTATHIIPETGETNINNRNVSLDNLLGGKMAKEVREKGKGTFEGEGLSIGGAMHKLLYDEKLPNFVKKYVKQWGAKVGKTQIQIHDPEFHLPEHANELTQEFYSVDITPEMRDSVLEGRQPLFMEADPPEVKQDKLMKSHYQTPPAKANVRQIEDIVKKGYFSALASEDMEALKKDLDSMGYSYVPAKGVYKGAGEDSLLVYYPDQATSRVIQYISQKHNQESVLHGEAGKYFIEYQDGTRQVADSLKLDKTSTVETGLKFQNEYAAEKGLDVNAAERPYMKVPSEELMTKLSKAHQEAEHSPDDKAVKKAYSALVKETADQYKFIQKSGIKIEPFEGDGEPYKNSKEMIQDIESGHYYYLPTDTAYGSGEKPSGQMLAPSNLKDSSGRDLVNNDVFRIVHDLMGHTGNKWQFGIRGEWNAFASHADLYSETALPALISETLMQNSVVAEKNYKRNGDKYELVNKDVQFADQKEIIPSKELIDEVKSAIEEKKTEATTYTKDGTYLTLPDGRVNFNVDFPAERVPADPYYSLEPAKVKFETRQKYKNTTILTPHDIKNAYNEGFVTGEDGIMLDTNRRDIIGSIGVWQQLVRDMNPNMEVLKKPEFNDSPDVKEAYNVKRAERYLAHIKSILHQWSLTDPDKFGARWYSEAPTEFAKKVGRDVKDVNNDVVKLWLFLTTAATSPNTKVQENAKFAQNAIASIVRFYESGKLEIPTFQYHNDGTLKLKEDGSPTRLGLGSRMMEKAKLLAEGWVPADTAEGWAAFDLGGEVKRASELLDNPMKPNDTYVFSKTAKTMMEKHGALQGVINYLISPSVGNKFNKAVDIFGDKIGAFMSNLMGFTQIPTIDTWMNRYFLGLTGDALEVKRDKNGVVTKVTDKSLQFDAKEGDFFRGVIQKATEDWNKASDKKLTPADVQAIVWTQVKDLFNSLVKAEQDNIDFSTAYDQIRQQMSSQQGLFADPVRNKEIPTAEHNPALIKDAKQKAPNVKALTEGNYSEDFGARHFIEQQNGMSFASEANYDAKQSRIDMSDQKLADGDFEAWIDLASSFVKNGILSDGEVNTIHDLAQKKDVEGLQKYVLQLNKMGVLELFVDFLRVNPLVGIKNIIRNISSNELHQIADEVSRVPAFAVDLGLLHLNKALGGDNTDRSILAPSFRATAKSMWKAVTEGVPNAASFLVKGDNSPNFEHPYMFRDRRTGWTLLRPLEIYNKYGFRLQEAADRPFKIQAYYRALDEITHLKAKEMGISVEEAEKHITIGEHDQAFEKALYLTFQDSNSIAKTYYQIRDGQTPFVRAIMNFAIPYIKTPLNVVGVALDYSGFYPLIKGINNKFGHKEWEGFKNEAKAILNTPEDRQAIAFGLGKGMVGWTLGYIGFKLAAAGLFTSFFDRDDKKEREAMSARGTGFGSVQVGGYSVDISTLSPVSFLMLSGAAFADAQKDKEEKQNKATTKIDDKVRELATLEEGSKEWTELNAEIESLKKKYNADESSYSATTAVSRILKNLALQTPILSTVVRTYEDNEFREKGGKVDYSSLLGLNRVVPAIVQEVAKTKDRKERVVDNTDMLTKAKQTIQSGIPVLREQLPPAYDMLGREIEAPYGFDPFKIKKVDDSQMLNDLDKFGISVGGKNEGSTAERNAAKKERMDFIKPYLETIMSAPQYKEGDDNTKKNILTETMRVLNYEDRHDKKTPEEEKHTVNVILEKNLFMEKMKKEPETFSKDRTITDKKMLSNITKLGIKDLSWNKILADIPDLDEFLSKQFRFNFNVGKDLALPEAQKNFETFKQDPELMVVKWYLSQKEYEERSNRMKARRSELTKAGKTEAEIEKILDSESAKRGWQNRRNKITSFEMKKDRTKEKFISYGQSDNVEDRRK